MVHSEGEKKILHAIRVGPVAAQPPHKEGDRRERKIKTKKKEQ